jgi:hypothetical protein
MEPPKPSTSSDDETAAAQPVVVSGDFQPSGYPQREPIDLIKPTKSRKPLIIGGLAALLIAILAGGWFIFLKNNKADGSERPALTVSSDSKNGGSDSGSGATENTAGQYVDEQGRFKVTPPSGWQLEPVNAADSFEFLDSDAPAEAAVRPSMSVTIGSTNGASLDQLAGAEEAKPGDSTNYKILSSESKTVSGLPAVLFTRSYTLVEVVDFQQVTLMTVKGDKVFTVDCTVDSLVWDQYKDAAREAVLSLKV